MGLGLELYIWAAERGLQLPLLIFFLILMIVLTIIIMNFQNKSDSTSICRDCMYKKRKVTGVLSCSLYKRKPLFMRKQQLECPIDELGGNISDISVTSIK